MAYNLRSLRGKDKGCFFASFTNNCFSFTTRSAISKLGSPLPLTVLPNNEMIVVWDESDQVGNNY